MAALERVGELEMNNQGVGKRADAGSTEEK